MFINFHYIRLLEEEKELAVLDQSFILKCCTIVTDTKSINRDVSSFEQFCELHPYPKPQNEYMGNFICALSRQMCTNIINHVVMNTSHHMIKYVRFKYTLDKKDARQFIYDSFNTYPNTKEQWEFKE